MLAVATFAAAAATPIPCASTQGDDSRTALCESWCSEFVYEFGTLDYALWPQKHCVYCKCRDCGFCPVSPPPLIAGLGAPERLRLRGHQLFWPSGAPAVLTGFNMQFQHGGRFGEPRVWDELLFRTLPPRRLVRIAA